MSLNPLHLIETRISVPRDLSAITTIAHEREVNPEWVGLSEDDKQAIWKAAEDLYRTGLYPALSLCIRRHGQVLIDRTIGHSHGNGPDDRDLPVLAGTDTPFCLFSASKAITAMLVHKLEEEGEIKVLNPVAHYLPEFGQNGKKTITIHDVLSHRAGIATLQQEVEPEMLFDYPSILKMLYEAKPTHLHGREQGYHALTGGYVMGEIIRRVTGMDIREYMRVTVQEPLGFKYFNYGVPRKDYPAVARNYFTGFPLVFPINLVIKRILGAPFKTAVELSNDPRFYDQIIPAGNITATAAECAYFYQCLANGGEIDGKRLFQPVTIERAIREVGRMQMDKVLMAPMRYSAGMMLGDWPASIYGPATKHAFGHLGLTNNFCWADPQRAMAASLLTSGNPVVGTHVPALVSFLFVLNNTCRPVFSD